MSGLTDKINTFIDADRSDDFDKIIQINVKGLEEILKIWYELYGQTTMKSDRAVKLVDNVKAFWECQIESQNERKRNVTDSIEQAGKDALRLEKILGLKPEVENLTCGKDVPLVTLEEQIWKILSSYQEISDKRLKEYSELQKKEEELCTTLNIKPQIRNEHIVARKGVGSKRKESFIPTSQNMSEYKERIYELEKQKKHLEYEFEDNKEKLRILLEQCEITPKKPVERYVCFGEEDFPVSNKNLKLLKSTVDHYQNIQKEMIAEANHLRSEITSLSKKMFLNLGDLECFLEENSGFTKIMITNLKEKLRQLKEERKKNLKGLIVSHRKILDELWKKCCYSEEEKNQFKAYHATHWSEDVLNFHELEIEKLENFYEQNKRIFKLAEKYDNLWARFLHLEEIASNKDRLFNNRGGRLLKEEKERKFIQKQVPIIRAELMELLTTYRQETGKDFVLYGMALQEKIEQKDEEREISKENERLMRKVINEENLFLESKLGVRQTPGNKRKVLTPQQANYYPKVMKTTAHSTPRISRSASCLSDSVALERRTWTRVVKEKELKDEAWLKVKPRPTKVVRKIKCDTPRPLVKKPGTVTTQCSLSYESFREHVTKSSSEESYEMCMKFDNVRVLRQRRQNQQQCLSEKKYHRCNTPIEKTFKSATTSKIPRAATPIGPRPTVKTIGEGTRRKLPFKF